MKRGARQGRGRAGAPIGSADSSVGHSFDGGGGQGRGGGGQGRGGRAGREGARAAAPHWLDCRLGRTCRRHAGPRALRRARPHVPLRRARPHVPLRRARRSVAAGGRARGREGGAGRGEGAETMQHSHLRRNPDCSWPPGQLGGPLRQLQIRRHRLLDPQPVRRLLRRAVRMYGGAAGEGREVRDESALLLPQLLTC